MTIDRINTINAKLQNANAIIVKLESDELDPRIALSYCSLAKMLLNSISHSKVYEIVLPE